jgi:hypothetical protein
MAPELDAVGVVEQPVEGGVSQGGLAQGIVPAGDGELAGDDGGAALIAILDDLEKAVVGPFTQGIQCCGACG